MYEYLYYNGLSMSSFFSDCYLNFSILSLATRQCCCLGPAGATSPRVPPLRMLAIKGEVPARFLKVTELLFSGQFDSRALQVALIQPVAIFVFIAIMCGNLETS